MPFPTTDWPPSLDALQSRADGVDVVDDDDFNYPDRQIRQIQTWLGVTGDLMGDGIPGEGPGGMTSPVPDGPGNIGFQLAVRAPYANADLLSVGDAYDTVYTEKMRLENTGLLWSLGGLQLAASTAVADILDEDNMASDSDTSLATQQSIKAYVDNSSTSEQNIIWVGKHGNDAESGASIRRAKLTIGSAVSAAVALGSPCAIIVEPGTYTEAININGPDIALIGLGAAGAVRVTNAAAATLTLGGNNIYLRNIRFTNTSAGAFSACVGGAGLTNIVVRDCEFACTNAFAAACVDFSGSMGVWFSRCWFRQTTTTRTAFAAYGAGSSLRLADCRFRGVVDLSACDFDLDNPNIQSANTTSAVLIGAPGAATRNNITSPRIICTGVGGAAIRLTASAPLVITGGHLTGEATSYDIEANGSYGIVVKGTKMDVGMEYRIDVGTQDRRVAASAGWCDVYKTISDAVRSVQAGNEGRVVMLDDITVTAAITPNVGSKVILDGQGHSLSRIGASLLATSANCLWDVRKLQIKGNVSLITDSFEVKLRDCELTDGYIDVNASIVVGGRLVLDHTIVEADGSNHAIDIQDVKPEIIVYNSFLKGGTGGGGGAAINYGVVNNNVSIGRSVLIHGAGLGTPPIPNPGGATTYDCYMSIGHDAWDVSLGGPLNLTNNIPVNGNVVSGMATAIDFDWRIS